MSEIGPYDWTGALYALTDGGVRFVLIGGVAARVLGSPSVTRDLDVCYARDRDNLEALSTVLQALHARLRGVPDDVPFRLDARTLAAGDSFTFVTDLGDLDVLATPSGTRGFDDLVRSAMPYDFGGRNVLVANIDDLIRMKRAAGRPKDLIEIELLGALREEVAEYG
ncbi:MAG TPA: hypothetical protein VJ850_09335 [Candidatus Limnocylindrales bacterium]|nr:hypothetical protein [Candidatus Limnocylindrales bacterium]